MSKERAAKVMQEIFSKGTYEGDLLGINEGVEMSDTPRTDIAQHNMGSIMEPHYVVDIDFAQQLERELAEVKEQLRLCNVDQWTTAAELAEAIANERERCAKVCEEMANSRYLLDDERQVAHSCAEAIRKG
jgi:hypothetical protein